MSRRAVLKVVKTNYTPNAPWMVRVPPRLHRIEGARKKFFVKESIAKAYVERLAKQLGDYHSQALGLSDRQKLEASECYGLLEGRDASLFDAVHHYLAYLDQTKRSIPVSELFDEFLSVKQQDNVSPKYLADLRSKLGRFVNSFHDALVSNLTVAQIEAWIRSLNIGTVSRESYRRNVSVLLEFGRRRGYLRANPAADIKIRRRPEGEVSILTPDELRNLLSKCAPEIVPYVATCAFAGLRPSEAANLEWPDIHLDTMQIEVRARHSKTRRYRLVPIQPNLGKWLMQFRGGDGAIHYSRRKFREAYRAAGMDEWKMDILRHSYGTYRLPILKSADALALEMGNSPDIIFRHYRRPMNEASAFAYFDLRPGVPPYPASNDAPSDARDESFQKKLIQRRQRNAPGTLNADRRQAA
ncbi:MAG TPA: tyrosine-type recombinase/integrase [Chthoniobacterales bacterium]|jgi:integrase|nr:tyrosine-type recombinase/integrase [Chthoniobacterales bacterium]